MTLNQSLADFITEQLNHQALTKPALVRRMGYVNFDKGLRRLNAILQNDLSHIDPFFRDRLAQALGLNVADIQVAEANTRSKLNAGFAPYAYLSTENPVPSPIFACAWGKFHEQKYIRFPIGLNSADYPAFVMKQLPKAIPTFGRVTGFHIHYSLDNALSFSLDGRKRSEGVVSPTTVQTTLYI